MTYLSKVNTLHTATLVVCSYIYFVTKMIKHRRKHKELHRNNFVQYQAFLERLDRMTLDEAILQPKKETGTKYRNYIWTSMTKFYSDHCALHWSKAVSYWTFCQRVRLLWRDLQKAIATPLLFSRRYGD